MTEVTLSSGATVNVRAVPPFFLAAVGKRHQVPENLTGEELQAAIESRARASSESAWLMALPDVEVPEEWQFPFGLVHAGVQPRDGKLGRWFDYVEYGLLETQKDIEAVQTIMYGGQLEEDDIRTAEDTFPADGGRDDASPDSGEPG